MRFLRGHASDDDDGVPITVFIPRPPRGPAHAGCIPIRSLMIVELMLKASCFLRLISNSIHTNFSYDQLSSFHVEAFKLPSQYNNVDHFSGKGAIAKGFAGLGYQVGRLDLALNPEDDPQFEYIYISFMFFYMCIQKMTRSESTGVYVSCPRTYWNHVASANTFYRCFL